MNNHRRKVIRVIIEMLNEASGKTDEAHEMLTNVADEEQECFDNMTEGLQQTERGQHIEETAEELSDIDYELDDVTSTINDLIERLENAIE